MTGQNGREPGTDPIAEILEPLRAKREEIALERQHVKAELDLLDVELKRIDSVLHAADPKPKTKKTSSGTSSVSEANVEIVLAAITKHAKPDEPFVAADVAGWASVSEGIAKNAIGRLREREQIRLIGRRPLVPGQRGLTPYQYKRLDV